MTDIPAAKSQVRSFYPAWMIAKREIRDQFRDWRIIFPVVGLTLIFPFIMNWTAQRILDFVNRYGATLIGERLVPFLLMIVGFFPISVSLVIALESFVGEKERSSIEPLLNTPLMDWQLYLGKLLASTVPPLVSSFLGMSVYLAGLAISHIPWPEPAVLAQIILLTIMQAAMMVSGAVVVSTNATSVRAANLLASFIIIPSAFLIQWEALVMFWGNASTLWWVMFGVLVLTVLLVRIGLAQFRREELLGREIDVLRLKYSWNVFRKAFTGGASGPADWYRRVIPQTLRRLRLPSLLTLGLVIAGFFIGMRLVDQFGFLFSQSQFSVYKSGGIGQALQSIPALSGQSVLLVWWQNTRVLILALILGLFTFGVLGVLPLMATMGVAGFLIGSLSRTGAPVLTLFAGLILPHGILEIPAAILASAAVLHAGACLAKPVQGKTVGEVWLESLADWAKVMVGIVAPMLLIASMIEVWVTPRIALLMFSR
ncbi:MAG TPA: stage II sporulation protein M [Anaerolineaceae bacterium]